MQKVCLYSHNFWTPFPPVSHWFTICLCPWCYVHYSEIAAEYQMATVRFLVSPVMYIQSQRIYFRNYTMLLFLQNYLVPIIHPLACICLDIFINFCFLYLLKHWLKTKIQLKSFIKSSLQVFPSPFHPGFTWDSFVLKLYLWLFILSFHQNALS